MRRQARATLAGSNLGRGGRSGQTGRTLLSLALAGALAALVALLAGSPATATAAGCANEAIRAEQGEAALALPDCRAYEVISPSGSSPRVSGGNVASLSGNRIAYRSWNPYTGQERESLRYVAERQANGWTVYNPIPPQNGAKTSNVFACNASFAPTPELDHLLLVDGFHTSPSPPDEELPVEGEECLGDEPPVDPDEPRGYANIFLTDQAGSSYQLMNTTPAGTQPRNAELAGYSADGSVAVFTEWAKLTPDAPEPVFEPNVDNGQDLYASRNGVVHYVPYLPDGTPVRAYLANGGSYGEGNRQDVANLTHAISTDGERIFFEYDSKLYLREHALREQSAVSGGACTEPEKACTIPIDTSEEGPTEFSSYGGRNRFNRAFLYATPDGSRVFFVDDRKLTLDATPALPVKNHYGELINGKSDLYEYNVASGETTDLTANPGEPANVRGFSGAAEDASYIYFAAFGDLTGAQQNGNGDTAQAGHNNLYVLHDDSITYIATMTGGESEPTGAEAQIWQEAPGSSHADESRRNQNTGNMTTRVTAGGRFFLFPSAARITTFDNTPAEPEDCPQYNFGAVPGAGCMELYLYDAQAQQLECVSCSPEGAAPTSSIRLEGPSQILWAGNGPSPTVMTHALSSDGTVFFETAEQLVPGDRNGVGDVYEYKDGAPHLISSGTALGASEFVDAGANGSDVFFSTGQSLVGRDADNSNSLYDARVGGGFVEPPPLPGCEGEACRGAATVSPATPAAGTPQFHGPGNQVRRHKRDCGLFSKRARKQSKAAKKLRRHARKQSRAAKKLHGHARKARAKHAAKLRHKARKHAKKAHKLSKKTKACRRDNRGSGK